MPYKYITYTAKTVIPLLNSMRSGRSIPFQLEELQDLIKAAREFAPQFKGWEIVYYTKTCGWYETFLRKSS